MDRDSTPNDSIVERRHRFARSLIAVVMAGVTVVVLSILLSAPAMADELNDALSELSARVRPGVVSIESLRPFGAEHGRCVGSGVVIEGGRIATTLYVAGPGDDVSVRFSDGRTTAATVVAVDPLREISILEPDEPGGRPLEFGNSDELNAGSWVFVVGYSLNTPEASLASGYYSSRTIFSPDNIELLQLEAQVCPGHSGGAVINTKGEMVGLVFGGLSDEGFLNPVVVSSFGDDHPFPSPVMMADRQLGIGFALPADVVKDAVRNADRTAETGVAFLGVRVDVAGTKGNRRVAVREVVPHSPASRAGLLAGEFIESIDGVPITSDSSLVRHVRGLKPGTTTRIVVDHPRGRATGEDQREVTITLGDYTTDYRMRLIRQRILAGRAANLKTAHSRLLEHLGVLEAELNQVTSVNGAMDH